MSTLEDSALITAARAGDSRAFDALTPAWNQRARRIEPSDSGALSRYVRAWNAGDVRALAAELRDDASHIATMTVFLGADAVTAHGLPATISADTVPHG